MLAKVRELAAPAFAAQGGVEALIVDDTGFQKKGSHSVGVARQYCGRLADGRRGPRLGLSAAAVTIPSSSTASLTGTAATPRTRR